MIEARPFWAQKCSNTYVLLTAILPFLLLPESRRSLDMELRTSPQIWPLLLLGPSFPENAICCRLPTAKDNAGCPRTVVASGEAPPANILQYMTISRKDSATSSLNTRLGVLKLLHLV